jgi:hypothetical protein
MSVHCAGCHCTFSISGYSSHVRRTGSSLCVAAYQARLREENDIENATEDEEDGMDVFSGDFFGDYDNDDFEWPDGGLSSIACVFAIQTYLGSGPLSEDENGCAIADEDSEDLIDIAASVSCAPAPDLSFKIEPFPLATAGAPILGSVRGASSFAAYGRALGINSRYAPFHSKLDWDVARWAKLHGSSSSAVSELLEIDGVCCLPRVFPF